VLQIGVDSKRLQVHENLYRAPIHLLPNRVRPDQVLVPLFRHSFSKETEYYSILDIKAKYNILSIKIAKNLSYIIYSVNTFTIFIVIRD
jgi:hypothetical protein